VGEALERIEAVGGGRLADSVHLRINVERREAVGAAVHLGDPLPDLAARWPDVRRHGRSPHRQGRANSLMAGQRPLRLDKNGRSSHVPGAAAALASAAFFISIRTLPMAKPATVKIKLVSSADTGFFYVTKKNPRTQTEKLSFKKYDPVARKHVEFKEAKIK